MSDARFHHQLLWAVAFCVFTGSGSAAADESSSVVVENPRTGKLADTHRLRFEPELRIGAEDGEDYEVLGRITDVALDPEGNIYALDRGYNVVHKYDSQGQHLISFGREGEGPGEFYSPVTIACDSLGHVYVGGYNPRVTIFDTDGNPAGSFTYALSGVFATRMICDTEGNVYVLGLDPLTHTLVHVYSPSFEFLGSFCDSYAVGKDVEPAIEGFYAGGLIDIDHQGNILFTRRVPYEIRTYSKSRALTRVIRTDHAYGPFPEPERTENGVMVRGVPMSTGLVVLTDGRFLNVVNIPPGDEDESGIAAVVDLYDPDGVLLLSERWDGLHLIRRRDHLDRLYVVESDGFPSIARYKLHVDELQKVTP